MVENITLERYLIDFWNIESANPELSISIVFNNIDKEQRISQTTQQVNNNDYCLR